MRDCPGADKCSHYGYIVCASEDPLYSDLMYECPVFREFTRARVNTEKLVNVLPKGLWERRLDNFVPEGEASKKAFDLSQKYASHRAWLGGSNLVFLGGYGTGKTHLAAGIAIEAVNGGDSVAFITAPSLRSGDFRTLDEKLFGYSRVNLLVIDDLSSETEYGTTNHRIFELINHRYEAGVGTIITSNLDIADFNEAVGARIFDRLKERTLIFELAGIGSYREKKRERYVTWAK